MKKIYITSLVVMIFSLLLMIPFHSKANPHRDFAKAFKPVTKALKGESYTDALDILNEISNEYGNNDVIREYRVLAYLGAGDISKCVDELSNYSNKASDIYDDLLFKVYLAGGSEYVDKMAEHCYEEADRKADNGEINLCAGAISVNRGEYKRAMYYLTRVDIRDNGFAEYFMGAALFELAEYEKSAECFATAMEKGVTEEMLQSIKAYAGRAVAYE